MSAQEVSTTLHASWLLAERRVHLDIEALRAVSAETERVAAKMTAQDAAGTLYAWAMLSQRGVNIAAILKKPAWDAVLTQSSLEVRANMRPKQLSMMKWAREVLSDPSFGLGNTIRGDASSVEPSTEVPDENAFDVALQQWSAVIPAAQRNKLVWELAAAETPEDTWRVLNRFAEADKSEERAEAKQAVLTAAADFKFINRMRMKQAKREETSWESWDQQGAAEEAAEDSDRWRHEVRAAQGNEDDESTSQRIRRGRGDQRDYRQHREQSNHVDVRSGLQSSQQPRAKPEVNKDPLVRRNSKRS